MAKFAYDDHDRLKYVTDPDNRMAQYTYYPDGKAPRLRKGRARRWSRITRKPNTAPAERW